MRRIILLIFSVCLAPQLHAADEQTDSILQRIFSYAQQEMQTALKDTTFYVYHKINLNVERRNIALLPVPTMYAVAHGNQRAHLAENIIRVHRTAESKQDNLLLYATSFPHRRQAMNIVMQYLSPQLYNETMFQQTLLSPFNRINKRYYRYRSTLLNDSTEILHFEPKIENTQLVLGDALVECATGRILSTYFSGEFDMQRFMIAITMDHDADYRDTANKAELTTMFRFLGNRVSTAITSRDMEYGHLMDHIKNQEDPILMGKFRPEPLSQAEETIYDDAYLANGVFKAEKKKNRFVKEVLWKTIGETLMNRIKSNFGEENRGYFRLNPLLNPLYMGYSDKKGVYYKYDLRASYHFTDNSNMMLRAKGGYSVKQHHFYFNIPLIYFFDKKHNGYLKLEVGNGNWLTNNRVASEALEIYTSQGIVPQAENLPYFKNLHWSLAVNRDLSEKFGLQIGIINYRRKAIDKNIYRAVGMPASYRSAAPMVEAEIRPWGWSGPIMTIDYERSIKGFLKAQMEYERWEFDAQYIQHLTSMQSLSYRVGFGFYTLKEEKPYFLDFTNFRENTLPSGWSDEWTGEFELLNSDYYNLSKHYIRANVTYESPLLVLSRLPLVGRYVEKERIYGSVLGVKGLFPYSEMGYGFTNRYFSAGMFTAWEKARYKGIGFKFGLELFHNW